MRIRVPMRSCARTLATVTAIAIGLTGCQKQTVERTPAALEHMKLKRIDPDHGRGVGAIVTEFGPEGGVGEVVSIDSAAQTVSLRHRQRSRADWPGMVMTFRIRRALIPTLSPGDRVYFRALVRDGAGEILVIQRAPAP
ncbi:copper-binding protein [uncultured Phenylobacterium sp.]|uniref:copper-binding protein n=1 Tax=uncultured Phenylobacterium sp. TaxID=349273 RepID=UPI0025F0EF7F|nr:copper-binding protein [uncultured Phenylobacterium sp.]